MAIIKPFKGIRPPQDLVEQVASRPYDVLNSAEAREEAKGNEKSLYHIIKPEIDFPVGTDEHDECVYQKAAENFQMFQDKGWLVQDDKENYYVYAQTMNGKTQYGLVVGAYVPDYMNGVIKKHELTRRDKEEDRMKHVRVNNANIEPVFFAYPDNATLDAIIAHYTAEKPVYDFIAPGDGFGHTFWIIDKQEDIDAITKEFAKMPALYIADGHHRSAAAALVGAEKAKQNVNHTGNEEYNYYQFADQTYLYDPDLRWETTITRNLGLDFGIFKNRLTGTVDVYWNTTKDLLVPSIIPNSSGYSRQMTNVGRTSNRGVELSLNGKIVQTKNFNLSASFNVAFNKNKVDKLSSGETEWKTKASLSNWYGTYNYKMEVGKSMGLIYGFVNDGFYTVDDFNFDETTKKWTLKPGVPDNSSFSSGNFSFKPGAMKFKKLSDSDSDLITEEDMTVIGNTNPKVTGGFGLSGSWKNLDFTAFFNYMCDFDVFNVNKLYLNSAVRRNYSNLSTNMNLARRFRYVDDAGVNVSSDPVALAALNQNAATYSWMSVTQGITMSDLIEDGSFLRLSTLTVGYTFPQRWLSRLGVKSLRLYFSGSNLFTLTGYSGYDPEVNIQKGLTPGIDNNVTPRSRVYTLGMNLNF